MARDRPRVDADEARRRLGRLTGEQRAAVIGALARLGPDDCPPSRADRRPLKLPGRAEEKLVAPIRPRMPDAS